MAGQRQPAVYNGVRYSCSNCMLELSLLSLQQFLDFEEAFEGQIIEISIVFGPSDWTNFVCLWAQKPLIKKV